MQRSIVAGDAQLFGAAMVDATRGSNTIRIEFMDSPGGDVDKVLKIGDLIGIAHVGTALLPNATCASGCVLVMASGTDMTWMAQADIRGSGWTRRGQRARAHPHQGHRRPCPPSRRNCR